MELTALPAVSVPLPWHSQAWARLQGQAAAGRLPHALLIAGERYTGKAQLALALSRFLLCPQPQGGSNCGECAACERSAKGVHGDFRWVQPEGDSRVIKVDQVRDLVGFLNQTAGFGAHKVAVLAPADAMNVNAFNALLKSLEEPGDGTFLLLVTDRLNQVPATIRSRCQLLKLASPGLQDSRDWLNTVTADAAASDSLLELAAGRPLLAQQFYLEGTAEEALARRAALPALLAGQLTPPMAAAAWASAGSEEFLEQLGEELQRIVSSLPPERLRSTGGRAAFALLDELAGLQAAVAAGSNPNRELLGEAILSKVQRELGALHAR